MASPVAFPEWLRLLSGQTQPPASVEVAGTVFVRRDPPAADAAVEVVG